MKGSTLHFSISQWSWWEPPASGAAAEIPEVPLLLRRRASVADRAALRVAFDCVGPKGETPAVFCSRHGEVHRSVELLAQLARGEPLSPSTFSLSVHNAAAALYSITRGDTSAISALAAGADSLPQGVIEAAAQLADGAEQVLVVAYDEALPAPFQRFETEDDAPGALGLLLHREGGPTYSLTLEAAPGPGPGGAHAPRLAGFLEHAQAVLEITSGPRRWTWRRHA